MDTPELKQIDELRSEDFRCHAVWVGVHNIDVGKPWYDASDESTFRPWDGELPVNAAIGFVLAKTSFCLKSGATYEGFARAVRQDWDAPPRPGLPKFSNRSAGSPLAILGLQQPRMFVGEEAFAFWGGRRGISHDRRSDFYLAIGEPLDSIFPITFEVDAGLARGILQGQIGGFYRIVNGQPPAEEC